MSRIADVVLGGEDVASGVLREHLGRSLAVTEALAPLRASTAGPRTAESHPPTVDDVLGGPVVKE